jgi:hypothetical protein
MDPLMIRHRVNAIRELEKGDPSWGAEIDLRSDVSSPGKIHLSHDPWVLGSDFEEWISAARRVGIRGPIILNTKEDGLEARAAELMRKGGLDQFFFLDTAIPTLAKADLSLGEFAVRFSRYEPVEFVEQFAGKATWLWVDCFDGVPVLPQDLAPLAKGFKVCLVSPELQGKPVAEIERFGKLLPYAAAVCTKDPKQWLLLSSSAVHLDR